jgi:hypothetical protein
MVPDPVSTVPEAFPEAFEELEPVDVQVEATGPEIDPHNVASVYLNYAEDASCSICLLGYGRENVDPCMKLDACVHMFHMECLSGWLNAAHRGLEMVRCPECRADICPRRPVAA